MDQKQKANFRSLNKKLQREVGVPLDSENIKKVKEVYKECQKLLPREWKGKRTPLHVAVSLECSHMVRVFIECAKLTSTDLETNCIGGFRQFLEYKQLPGETALDEAQHMAYLKRKAGSSFKRDLAEIFELLMKESTNDEYDGQLFEVLEETAPVPYFRQQSGIGMTSPTQEEYMGPSMYGKAMWVQKGSIDLGMGNTQVTNIQISKNKNTFLHIAMQFGNEKYVQQILTQMPWLLCKRNVEGETPAYIAAREGHSTILKMIIDHVKQNSTVNPSIEELMTRNTDNNTALHAAVRNHHAELVFLLTKEVPKLSDCTNGNGESAIYIASEKRYDAFVRRILDKCDKPSFEGPKGKTAVHAAATSGSRDCIEYLVNSIQGQDLLCTLDEDGRTPLYYAVKYNHSSVVEFLLLFDKASEYHTFDNNGSSMPALHFAASQGHCETMHVLIDKSPGCWEMRTDDGRNVLHLVVKKEKTKVIEFILADTRLTSLINQKDNDGNTPLHLVAASKCEMEAFVKHHRIELNALNKENKSPLDVASSPERRSRLLEAIIEHKNEDSCYSSESEVTPADSDFTDRNAKEMNELANGVILVATLIATAAFAAGLAVPGGFDGNVGANQGIPILIRKVFFKIFTVANALAFICSSSALFGFLRILYIRLHYSRFRRREDYFKWFDYQGRLEDHTITIYFLIGIAMVTMVIAFIAGLFVVLEHELAFAILICVICVWVSLFSSLFAKRFVEIVGFSYKFLG